jgi:hypothetical protein
MLPGPPVRRCGSRAHSRCGQRRRRRPASAASADAAVARSDAPAAAPAGHRSPRRCSCTGHPPGPSGGGGEGGAVRHANDRDAHPGVRLDAAARACAGAPRSETRPTGSVSPLQMAGRARTLRQSCVRLLSHQRSLPLEEGDRAARTERLRVLACTAGPSATAEAQLESATGCPRS